MKNLTCWHSLDLFDSDALAGVEITAGFNPKVAEYFDIVVVDRNTNVTLDCLHGPWMTKEQFRQEWYSTLL